MANPSESARRISGELALVGPSCLSNASAAANDQDQRISYLWQTKVLVALEVLAITAAIFFPSVLTISLCALPVVAYCVHHYVSHKNILPTPIQDGKEQPSGIVLSAVTPVGVTSLESVGDSPVTSEAQYSERVADSAVVSDEAAKDKEVVTASPVAVDPPFFSSEDRQTLWDQGIRGQYYNATEEEIVFGLKMWNFTKSMMHGSQLLHGSSSASLMAFTKYNQNRKGLLCEGVLEDDGKVSFCGTHDRGHFGCNRKGLSTCIIGKYADTVLREILVRYSRAVKWTPELGKEFVSKICDNLQAQVLKNDASGEDNMAIKTKILNALDQKQYKKVVELFLKHNDLFDKLQDKLYIQRLIIKLDVEYKRVLEWDKLDESEKLLVQKPFPVLYGIKSHGVLKFEDSGVFNALLLEDGARPDEIRVIFVPKSKLEFVKKLMKDNGNDLVVEPFPKIKRPWNYSESEFDPAIFV
jgi:hypothetical protein